MLWLPIFSLLLLEKSRYNTIAAKTRKHTISLHFVMAFQKPTNLFLAKQVNNRRFDKTKRRKNFVKRRFGKFFRCLDVYWVYRSGLSCRKNYRGRWDNKMKKEGIRSIPSFSCPLLRICYLIPNLDFISGDKAFLLI